MQQLPLADQPVSDLLLIVFFLNGGHNRIYVLILFHQGLKDHISVSQLPIEIYHVKYDY